MALFLGWISATDIILFWFVLLAIIGFLLWFAWFNWKMTWKKIDNSPYTGLPLRYGRDIGYSQSEKVLGFLFELKQYDNRMFDLNKASFCRETGRIFEASVTWLDSIRVNWDFLQKKAKGHYVSWGSLTDAQQQAIRKQHASLRGFQTDLSSPTPSPRMIEPEYAYAKPGPLYVDVATGNLLGWKEVPGTPFEVLILQKPTEIIYQHTE